MFYIESQNVARNTKIKILSKIVKFLNFYQLSAPLVPKVKQLSKFT